MTRDPRSTFGALWSLARAIVLPPFLGGEPGRRWASGSGNGLPRPAPGVVVDSRVARVDLDPDAAQVIAVLRPELAEYQCVEPDDDEDLPMMVWLKPDEPPTVVVHADKFRLGTVADADLYDVVASVFDPRHPRHSHTEAWLTPSNQILLNYCNAP